MKHHHPFILRMAKVLFSCLKAILSLRYRVEIENAKVLHASLPKLILPNHQAIMDPIVLFAHLYSYTTAVPVITSSYYDLPLARKLFAGWGAIRVSDLEAGSRNVKVLEQIVSAVNKGFDLQKNIVLYPGGQIAGQGYEKILNKQSAYRVVKELPENVDVIAVRINGFWGSRWSKAWTGQSSAFFMTLLKSIGLILANLIFFMPRRKITIEFENITQEAKIKSTEDKATFNRFLEDVYNVHGEEQVNYLKAHFLAPPLKRKLPEKIIGSDKEAASGNLLLNEQSIPTTTLKLVKLCVGEILNISSDNIKASDYLQLDLGADSLNLVEILSEVENSFPSFSAPQINEIKTVADLCLVAMGQFKSESDLPPSNLHQQPAVKGLIKVKPTYNIISLFIESFSINGNDPFVYDSILGSTNKKSFFLKACVVSELIKQRVSEKYVGIMLPALQSTTLLIAACYLAGKIPVMLNWTTGASILEHCIKTAGVTKIVSAGSFYKKVKELLPDSIHSKMIFLEQEVPKISLSNKVKGLLKAKMPSLIKINNIDETAVVLFTSGSETLPKAVPLTHENIVSDLAAAFNMVTITNDEIFLSFLPPFHSFGFTVLNILPLITGAKVAYTPNPTDAREVLRVLKHVQANIIIGTPGFLNLLLAEGTPYFFKSVHYAISGAEAMPQRLKEKFESMTNDAKMLEGYGITECSPVISLNPQDKQKINSVGRLLPGISGLILDIETGERLGFNKEGMIYVSGNNVFNGYLDQPGLDPFETIDGKSYYKTGDLGYFDEEGFLFITGRFKRFIKIAGEMISLPFIEHILLDIYGEADEQVLAVEGSDKCSLARIILFTKKNIDLNEANLHLRKKGVASLAKISLVVTLDELPKLGSGKINYRELKVRVERMGD